MTRKKVINSIMLDDGTSKFEGIRTATGEQRGREPNMAAPDDVPNLNPQGWPGTDARSTQKHRLSCRVGVRIGTWIVRSMYEGKLEK